MDINEIFQKIPHRFPFIMIDRIISIEKGKKIVAIKNVTMNEMFFLGHFPGNPIMPGVLIVEALAQAGGILAREMSQMSGDNPENVIDVFAGMDKVRFRRLVVPGDQLELHVEFVKKKGIIWKMKGEARVDGEIACSAIVTSAKRKFE